jgi:hypothetical protein
VNLPTFDFEAHLARQAAFSARTFGPGARTEGICDHIRKELLEVAAAPGDLKEWIDVAILALDGAWRCGATPAQIIGALEAKQSKNEGRAWPDWRTADPAKAIEHDRSGEHAVVAAASAPTQGPFMYGIMGPDGKAHMDENCVGPDAESLYSELNGLNDSPDAGFTIVELFKAPAQPVAVPQETLLLAALNNIAEACNCCGDRSDLAVMAQEALDEYADLSTAMAVAP